MIAATRIQSQQLAKPNFDNPRDLVAWMGALQAQDYNMSKWAVGIRLNHCDIRDVESALQRGEILRTHVMRPTWHLVAAEDIRWMLQLTGPRLKSVYVSYGKHYGITEKLCSKCNNLIEKTLQGGESLTKQEMAEALNKSGVKFDTSHANIFLSFAEADGIICSGVDKGAKVTYALLEERVAPVKALHKEEALARLAQKYFRSHSPASVSDFAWWSGLSLTEARHAVGLIQSELIIDKFAQQQLLLHESCSAVAKPDNRVYLLPAFDEYIISYKDRSTVMDAEHHPKAFTSNGIFHPTIMHKGKVVGRWSKAMQKGKLNIETSFFETNNISETQLKKAKEKYKTFVQK